MISSTPLIVLTGGPGAGKTAVLEFARKIVPNDVVIFPEAASILFMGGFWRFDSATSKKAAQRAIYHVQQEMQNLVIEEKKWRMGLCDRGTLDGLAYWPGAEPAFFEALSTSREKEYSKYLAVIHLRTPSLEDGYNYQNPARTESVELAAAIDQKIHFIWKDHPNYHIIESQTDFIHKADLAIRYLQKYISWKKPENQ